MYSFKAQVEKKKKRWKYFLCSLSGTWSNFILSSTTKCILVYFSAIPHQNYSNLWLKRISEWSFCHTWEWHFANTSLVMMLHCFCAQAFLYGFAVHGSLVGLAFGQLEDTFQLLANSSTFPTTDWLRVVKSLFPLPS